MILLISGSRSLDDTEVFKRAIHEFLLSKFGNPYPLPINTLIDQIVSGHAKGVDAAAERFAKKHGIDLAMFPANWEKNSNAAGPIRNEDMANYGLIMKEAYHGLDLNLVAIPYPGAVGGGTNHMIATCQKLNIPTFVYDASKHSRWNNICAKNSN